MKTPVLRTVVRKHTSIKQYLDHVEQSLIVEALTKSNWCKSRAASLCGIPRTTLLQRMSAHGIPFAPVNQPKGQAA